jgi:CelD/BcsL family acetyltransferase involved in cellulose biosynthesis
MTTVAELRPALTGARAAIQVQVVRGHSEFSAMRQEWGALLGSDPGASIFQSWEWCDAWLRAYGDRDLFVLAGFQNGDLVGLLPLYISSWLRSSPRSLRVLRLIGDDPDDAGGLGMMAKCGLERDFAAAAVASLLSHRDEWDALRLSQLSKNSASHALLDDLRQHRFVIRECLTPHMVLDLRDRAPVESNARSSRKGLTSQRLEFHNCSSRSEFVCALEHLFRLHEARWNAKGKEGAFAAGDRKEFSRIMSESMFEAGRLDMWTLRVDGSVVAVELGLILNDVRYRLQSGFEPDYRKHKVGALLDSKIIESAIARGITFYDFLEGDEPFKRQMGANPQPYTLVRCAPAKSRGALWVRTSGVKALQRFWAAMNGRRAR